MRSTRLSNSEVPSTTVWPSCCTRQCFIFPSALWANHRHDINDFVFIWILVMLRNLIVYMIIRCFSFHSSFYIKKKKVRYKYAIGPSYLKEMANELGSALFLTRKAPSRGTLISMFSAWLLERLAWYHLGMNNNTNRRFVIIGMTLCHFTPILRSRLGSLLQGYNVSCSYKMLYRVADKH